MKNTSFIEDTTRQYVAETRRKQQKKGCLSERGGGKGKEVVVLSVNCSKVSLEMECVTTMAVATVVVSSER